VLARDASAWRGSVTISAGEREGIAAGQPVVVGNALCGVVTEVWPLAARVRLLTDPGHRVWAELDREGERTEGYVAGRSGALEMRLVPAGAGGEGAPVFTGAGSALVPRGLLIGVVTRFTDDDRDGVAEVDLEPAVDAGRVRIVNVLASE